MDKEEALRNITLNLRLLAENIEVLLESNDLDVEEKPKAKKEKKTEKTEEQPKVITLEEVRSVLAIKSKDGFTEQIKEIINRFGADKLSEVDPANLGELLKEAEKLG